MSELKPGIALIPGGTRGLGRSIALALGELGWKIALAYRDDAKSAQQTARDLSTLGATFTLSHIDLSVPKNAESFVANAVKKWQRVDALINAIGSYDRRSILKEDAESWREAWATNLDAVYFLCRAASEEMKRRGGGRIINFGVVNAASAPPAVGAHHLAKAAVAGMSRCFARALASDKITVNTLALGICRGSAGSANKWAIPAGRLGKHSEVVGAVRYLLSEEAAYTNGAELAISGAWGI